MKRTSKICVAFGLSAVVLAWTLRRVSFGDLANALASAHYRWFLPAAVFWIASYYARALRWSILMGGAPLTPTLHAQNIGYLLNSTLPFRLGEVARAYVIGERTSISMARAFSAIVVERVLDLATVVAMFAVAAQYVPMPPAFSQAAMAGGTFVLFLLVVGFVFVWKAEWTERVLIEPIAARFSSKFALWVVPKFHEVCAGFRSVGSLQRLAFIVALTVAVWSTIIGFTAFVLYAFVPTAVSDLSKEASLVVITSNLGGALPSAPGGLGIVQGFATAALVVPFQVPEHPALAFVLVWSLGQQLLLIVLGLLSLAAVGMSFTQIRTRSADGSLHP